MADWTRGSRVNHPVTRPSLRTGIPSGRWPRASRTRLGLSFKSTAGPETIPERSETRTPSHWEKDRVRRCSQEISPR